MLRLVLLSTIVFFTTWTLAAQSATLSGVVLDAGNRQALSGVHISVLGKKGTTTDNTGYFSLPCTPGASLQFSYIGYETAVVSPTDCSQKLTVLLQPKMESLDSVLVVASVLQERQMLEQAGTIQTLQDHELKRGNGLFLDDAINTSVPGVSMSRRTISAGQQFNIRGYGNGIRGTNGLNSNFDGQGYKVYLNGIPVTDAEGITLMDDIDFASVRNIEVIKGPAGTQYGLAIAGVVNLSTDLPSTETHSVSQDALIGQYGLYRFTTRVRASGEKGSVQAAFGRQGFDGYMAHTASDKYFANVLAHLQASSHQRITAFMSFSDSYDQRNGELTIQQYETLDYSGNPDYIKNNAHSGVKTLRAGISDVIRLGAHIKNTTSVFGSGFFSDVSSAGGWTDKTSLNYGIRSVFETSWTISDHTTLNGSTGIEAQNQQAQTIGYGMVADSFNLAGYRIIGPMKSNQWIHTGTHTIFSDWTINLPAAFSIQAGIGFSNMNISLFDRLFVASNNNPSNTNGTHKPSTYEAHYGSLAAPRFAVNKKLGMDVSAYISYSTGYKAPVSSYFFIPVIGTVNTGLVPEKGTQLEAGLKGMLYENRLMFQLAAFQANYLHKMTVFAVPNAANTATSYTYVANGGSQHNKGLELLLRYQSIQSGSGFLAQLTPFLNAAYAQYRYGDDFVFQQLSADKKAITVKDFSGNQVAGVPPLTLNTGLDFLTQPGFYGTLTYSYKGAFYYTSDGANQTQAYGLLNGKVGFKRTLGQHLSADAYLGAYNIGQVQYPYMVFLNQLPDAFLPAPLNTNYFGGFSLKFAW